MKTTLVLTGDLFGSCDQIENGPYGHVTTLAKLVYFMARSLPDLVANMGFAVFAAT